ncbi:MAG: 16S rRNA (guanine(966)-N(2))-methyltransferase RsmD [Fusobacteriia bacterium 4572_132]|nr:MAG: 16S rRNA (guanine(966)-N(2))-methyltransferase RsmD [Fusobacteriia bacterium 4572_132]
MRIIAGEAKNKKIKALKTMDVRPTSDRVKESLFSIIDQYIPDSVFLDLFSGTGNIALEALSRGAKKAILIEKENKVLGNIIENINNLGFEDRCRAYKNEAERAIVILAKKNEMFDVIFMDPPYKEELCTSTIEKVEEQKILKENGLLIAEHHIKERMAEKIGELNKVDERIYGNKVMTFYAY